MLLSYQSIRNMYLAKIKCKLVFCFLETFDSQQFTDVNKGGFFPQGGLVMVGFLLYL